MTSLLGNDYKRGNLPHNLGNHTKRVPIHELGERGEERGSESRE